ncbi:MAG TPA: type VI secretion system ImpA family N-terminal domain-containing protein, partial [Longimicrobiales bacterium]|nr:type VI secretion system ImpA family N-terminal domain-containing protein [Longimicrobiales bacterium]
MPLPDDILEPISPDAPVGADLRYEAVYDEIREAREEELDLPQGDWQRERKTADFAKVLKLATDVLQKRSKDLQVAAWLTEAKLRREGFQGLHEGIDLLRGLLDRYWEGLYPPIEDGDVDFRATPLRWIESY